jgi:hypothetical protein
VLTSFLPCPLPSSENDEGGRFGSREVLDLLLFGIKVYEDEKCLLSLRLARGVPRTNPPPLMCGGFSASPQKRVQTQIEQGWKVERPDCGFSLVPADKSQGTESGEIHSSNFRDADATANHGTVSALSYPSYSSINPAMTHGSYPLYLPSHDRPRRKLHR